MRWIFIQCVLAITFMVLAIVQMGLLLAHRFGFALDEPVGVHLALMFVFLLCSENARKEVVEALDQKRIEEFRKRFPGKCFICSAHRHGWSHGMVKESKPPAHECIEFDQYMRLKEKGLME